MKNELQLKLERITNVKNFQYLLSERQDQNRIKQYYTTNSLPYLQFHNRLGFLHMGISNDGNYKKDDLYVSVGKIDDYIKSNDKSKVLELGFGRGANLNFLAKRNPNVEFYGIDLSTKPLKQYSNNSNIKFVNGDYHNIKDLIEEKFGIVFAIEAVCHSNDLNALFVSISDSLEEGGYFILFDGYYLKNKEAMNDYEKKCCTFVEKGMSVDKFHNVADFEQLAESTKLKLVNKIDYSKQILPSLYRFEKLAKVYFEHKTISRIVNKILPEMFIRNSLAGYLMPDLIKNGLAGYYMHIFKKQ